MCSCICYYAMYVCLPIISCVNCNCNYHYNYSFVQKITKQKTRIAVRVGYYSCA